MLAKVMNYSITKYNVEMCCYDTLLVNVALYEFLFRCVCVWCGVNRVPADVLTPKNVGVI